MARNSILAEYHQLIRDSLDTLRLAVQRAEENREARQNMRLGEHNRSEFLAHAGLTSLDAALSSAQVLRRTKRSAIVRVGDIHLLLNRFGVATYLLPMNIAIGRFNLSQHSLLDSSSLLEAIGATHDGYDRTDPTYSYANLNSTCL